MPAIRLYAAPGMDKPNGRRPLQPQKGREYVRLATTNNYNRSVVGEVVNNQAKYESMGRFIYNLYFKR